MYPVCTISQRNRRNLLVESRGGKIFVMVVEENLL